MYDGELSNIDEVYELCLIGINYIESKLYANGQLALTIEENIDAETLNKALIIFIQTLFSQLEGKSPDEAIRVLDSLRTILIKLRGEEE